MTVNRMGVKTKLLTCLSKAEVIRRIKRKKMVVIMGGLSAERDISRLTGQAMMRALQAINCNVSLKAIKTRKDLLSLATMKPAVVINGLHGPGGEDGQVQAILDWMGIPYTGSGTVASALAMDKHMSKQLFRANGLPTADWILLGRGAKIERPKMPLPVVVKPNRLGSAIGISVVKQPRQWKSALAQAKAFGDDVMVEKYCPGREISVGVINGQALPVIEIVPKNSFYDFEAKYAAGMSEHIIPARLTPALSEKAQKMAIQASIVLGCKGTPRVDMIVGKNGKITILEVNTLPGMTSTSLLPDAARHAGIDFEHLVGLMILDAWGVQG